MEIIKLIVLLIFLIVLGTFCLKRIFKIKKNIENLTQEENNTLKGIREKLKGIQIFNYIMFAIIIGLVTFSIILSINSIIEYSVLMSEMFKVVVRTPTTEIFTTITTLIIWAFIIYILKSIIMKIYVNKCKKLNESEKALIEKIYNISILGLIFLFIFLDVYRVIWGFVFSEPYY